MKKEPVIIIKVGDWAEEYQTAEPQITSEDDLVKLVTEQKMTTTRASRLGIMAREYGVAPEDILPPNKLILQTGGVLNLNPIPPHRNFLYLSRAKRPKNGRLTTCSRLSLAM